MKKGKNFFLQFIKKSQAFSNDIRNGVDTNLAAKKYDKKLITPIKGDFEIIFLAQYCPCIQESAFHTISAHRLKTGAENSIKIDKMEKMNEFKSLYSEKNLPYPFGTFQKWRVIEIKLY